MTAFSYEEITASTEKYIIKVLDERKKSSVKAVQVMYLDYAYGTFFSWSTLTMGKHIPADTHRLLNLIQNADEVCPF